MRTLVNTPGTDTDERELCIIQFIKIKDIARKTAEAFYEIGNHSCADLAIYLRHHTAEEISAALKLHGVDRSPGFIKIKMGAWIHQAEEFSQLEKNTSSSPEGDSDPKKKPEGSASNRDPKPHEWEFTVFFDMIKEENSQQLITTVYDVKKVGSEMEFEGSDTSKWVNWILEQANLPIALETFELTKKEDERLSHDETRVVAPTALVEPYDAQIVINSIELNEIKPPPSVQEKMLQAEISFQLSGTHSKTLTSQGSPYRIEISSIEYGSSTQKLLALHDDQLKPDRFEYTNALEFPMPPVGQYELHGLILLFPSVMLRAYHKGPNMQIIP